MNITLPYGKTQLELRLPDALDVTLLMPHASAPTADPQQAVRQAIESFDWSNPAFTQAHTVAIAINDKTRPVPTGLLLPPLLAQLHGLGLRPEQITFLIATGSHPPMRPEEFALVLPEDILWRYRVLSHNALDTASLVTLGTTPRGTPVTINRVYAEADLRLVVGNIDPHQFQGFTGGVKGAVIGLAGLDTINANHRWMTHPDAELGRYRDNPARQDIEDIGRIVGVHLALNAILTDRKEIVHVFCDEPLLVMHAAIPLVRHHHQLPVTAPFDLVIASPGGYPKDINVYQAQKALGHAALVTKADGAIILAAACGEGSGSPTYEQWVSGSSSHQEVIERFTAEGFTVGPHKAYQIARDSVARRVIWVSDHPDMNKLLLETAPTLEEALTRVLHSGRSISRVGVIPYANSTIPALASAPA